MEKIDDPYTKALSFQFESLGQNCEMGFALRKLGNEDGQLLRWAIVPIDSLARMIAALPAEIYRREDLVPIDHDMVLDRAIGIRFHCAFRFQKDEAGVWQPVAQAIDDDTLYAQDRDKFAHMYRKFVATLTEQARVFVYKYHTLPQPEQIAALREAIVAVSGGRSRLAIVHEDASLVEDMVITRPDPHLILCAMRALVDNRYHATDSYGVWHRFFREAALDPEVSVAA